MHEDAFRIGNGDSSADASGCFCSNIFSLDDPAVRASCATRVPSGSSNQRLDLPSVCVGGLSGVKG